MQTARGDLTSLVLCMISLLMLPEFELAGLTGLELSSCDNNTEVFKIPMCLESTSAPCYRSINSLPQACVCVYISSLLNQGCSRGALSGPKRRC